MMIAAIDGMLLHALSSPHDNYNTWTVEWIGRLGIQAAQLGDTTNRPPHEQPET